VTLRYPVSVPMELQLRLTEFLMKQFLEQTIVRCQQYLREGHPDLNRQMSNIVAQSFGRDDTVKFSHTFDQMFSAPMIASHVQLMGGDPCPPVATEKPKKKVKKGKKR
jgi:hypothetical protein